MSRFLLRTKSRRQTMGRIAYLSKRGNAVRWSSTPLPTVVWVGKYQGQRNLTSFWTPLKMALYARSPVHKGGLIHQSDCGGLGGFNRLSQHPLARRGNADRTTKIRTFNSGRIKRPGRQHFWQRDKLCRFWWEVALRQSSKNAAGDAGVSGLVGILSFRSSGGRPVTHLALAPSAQTGSPRHRLNMQQALFQDDNSAAVPIGRAARLLRFSGIPSGLRVTWRQVAFARWPADSGPIWRNCC